MSANARLFAVLDTFRTHGRSAGARDTGKNGDRFGAGVKSASTRGMPQAAAAPTPCCAGPGRWPGPGSAWTRPGKPSLALLALLVGSKGPWVGLLRLSAFVCLSA